MTTTPPQIEHLGRRSKQAAIISLVGFLLVLAAIGFSIWQIGQLQARKDALATESAALEARVATLDKDIQAKRETLDRISRQVAAGDVKAVEKTLVQQAAQPASVPVTRAPAGAAAGDDALIAAAPPAAERRVYFQIRSRDQTRQYQACGAILRKAGYRVPLAEYVPDRGPPKAEVRYFREEEASEAKAVAGLLRGCLRSDVQLNLIGGYRDSPLVKPMQFEVWFAPAGR